MPKSRRSSSAPIAVDAALLRRWALPEPGADADKEDRGRVMIVGGSAEIPGALILAGCAALRAGAGKLQIATAKSAAVPLAIAVPEARVIALGETRNGAIAASAAKRAAEEAGQSHATLVGPGMMGDSGTGKFVERFLGHFGDANLVLDAGAVAQLHGRTDLLKPMRGRVLLTPHVGEMASMTGIPSAEIARNPGAVAVDVAKATGAVISLKGPETWIASPDGKLLCYRQGGVGLATSGSGDVLAGIAAGLLARGADPLVTAAWASYLHGASGRILARRVGNIGFLARELLSEIPGALSARSRAYRR